MRGRLTHRQTDRHGLVYINLFKVLTLLKIETSPPPKKKEEEKKKDSTRSVAQMYTFSQEMELYSVPDDGSIDLVGKTFFTNSTSISFGA